MLDFGFYNMDCMEGMKQFPDKYFDLAIVDPPYGDGGGAHGSDKTRAGSAERSTVIDHLHSSQRKREREEVSESMFCENAFYPGGDEKKRLHCKSARKAAEDTMTKDKCPLIYYCRINQRFENTADMFNCQYREKKNDGQ